MIFIESIIITSFLSNKFLIYNVFQLICLVPQKSNVVVVVLSKSTILRLSIIWISRFGVGLVGLYARCLLSAY